MDLGLKNRVAIVTGGSKGIGKAIAQVLAAEDASVLICARQTPPLEETCAQIQKKGGKAAFVCADVSDPQAVKNVIDTAVKQFGGLDILVNNAGGVDKFGSFCEIDDDDWKRAFDVRRKKGTISSLEKNVVIKTFQRVWPKGNGVS